MAYAILRQGDIQKASALFEDNIRNTQKANLTIGLVHTMEGLASLNVNQGRPKHAAQLFAWADIVREKLNNHRAPVAQASVEKDLAVIHSQLDDAEFTSLSANGRTMTTEQAIALALEENAE